MNVGAFLDKQEAYHLSSRHRSLLTWNNFVRLMNTARSVYASTERDYSAVIKETMVWISLISGGPL